MSKSEKLKQVAIYRFAAFDMQLYLDTHPTDKKAFSLFSELVERYKKECMEYEKEYGPLKAFSSANNETYNWLNSPWPWE